MSVQYVASQQSKEHNVQWITKYAFIGNKKLKWTDVKICILNTKNLISLPSMSETCIYVENFCTSQEINFHLPV
jgi:uncharacterized Fe-S cluster-containing protein